MAELIEISEFNKNFADELKVRPEIHSLDFVYHYLQRKWHGDRDRAVINYYNIGKYGANLTKEVVSEVSRIKERVKEDWKPKRILDFASGYGNSSRHLQHFFPELEISSCDIHGPAVEFNQQVLGVQSYLSATNPESLDVPQHDIIVAMSFFSHMPHSTFGRWLQALTRTLSPGGALIFTANGYVTDKTGNTGIATNEKGFGFRAASEQHDLAGEQYGLTISYPEYVFEQIKGCNGLRLSRFHEGLWWTTQDTYVCIREG